MICPFWLLAFRFHHDFGGYGIPIRSGGFYPITMLLQGLQRFEVLGVFSNAYAIGKLTCLDHLRVVLFIISSACKGRTRNCWSPGSSRSILWAVSPKGDDCVMPGRRKGCWPSNWLWWGWLRGHVSTVFCDVLLFFLSSTVSRLFGIISIATVIRFRHISIFILLFLPIGRLAFTLNHSNVISQFTIVRGRWLFGMPFIFR